MNPILKEIANMSDGGTCVIDGYMYASNLHIAARQPTNEPDKEGAYYARIAPGLTWDRYKTDADPIPLPGGDIKSDNGDKCKWCDGYGHVMDCEECNGTGSTECSACSSVIDCEECAGACRSIIRNKDDQSDDTRCEECNGHGYDCEWPLVRWPDTPGPDDRPLFISAEFVALLKRHGARLYPPPDMGHICRFEVDDVEGLVAGMKRPPNDSSRRVIDVTMEVQA